MNREMDMWIDMRRVDEIIDKLSKVLMSSDRSTLWFFSCVELGAFRIGTVHCALQLWFAEGIFMLGCTNNLKAGLEKLYETVVCFDQACQMRLLPSEVFADFLNRHKELSFNLEHSESGEPLSLCEFHAECSRILRQEYKDDLAMIASLPDFSETADESLERLEINKNIISKLMGASKSNRSAELSDFFEHMRLWLMDKTESNFKSGVRKYDWREV